MTRGGRSKFHASSAAGPSRNHRARPGRAVTGDGSGSGCDFAVTHFAGRQPTPLPWPGRGEASPSPVYGARLVSGLGVQSSLAGSKPAASASYRTSSPPRAEVPAPPVPDAEEVPAVVRGGERVRPTSGAHASDSGSPG